MSDPCQLCSAKETCTGLQERIEIMHALSTSAPQLRQVSSIMQDSLPVPSAPPMAGGADESSRTYPHIWQPSEGEHAAHVPLAICLQ